MGHSLNRQSAYGDTRTEITREEIDTERYGEGGGYGDWRPTVVFPSIEEKSVVALHNAAKN